MELYFRMQDFARSTTHNEWIEIWRWKRIKTKELKWYREAQLRLLQENIPTEYKKDIIDRMINPPIVMHDKQNLTGTN